MSAVRQIVFFLPLTRHGHTTKEQHCQNLQDEKDQVPVPDNVCHVEAAKSVGLNPAC